MEIEGYSYPFARDDWDANWLQIKINITDVNEGIFFEQSDPCLLTMEIVDLYKWFSVVDDNKQEMNSIKFMEPNISFTYQENLLSIILKYAFNPFGRFDESYKMDFKINNDIRCEILKKLKESIAKFPKRLNPR